MHDLKFEKNSSTLSFDTFKIRGLVCSAVPNGKYAIVKENDKPYIQGIKLEIGHASVIDPVIVVQNEYIMQRVVSWLEHCVGGNLYVDEKFIK